MSEGAQILRMTERAFEKATEPRDPKVDAETVATFIQALIDNKVPSDLIKDLAIGYLLRL